MPSTTFQALLPSLGPTLATALRLRARRVRANKTLAGTAFAILLPKPAWPIAAIHQTFWVSTQTAVELALPAVEGFEDAETLAILGGAWASMAPHDHCIASTPTEFNVNDQ